MVVGPLISKVHRENRLGVKKMGLFIFRFDDGDAILSPAEGELFKMSYGWTVKNFTALINLEGGQRQMTRSEMGIQFQDTSFSCREGLLGVSMILWKKDTFFWMKR